ncbi:MAG: pyridoxamine 5'-phosphate oxidase family protein, partial [Polyangiaceae bacterium]|nr:pyridoxamine 5'-phosphate oxidase family protein [Polyangiaceae bacterium]
MKFTGKQSDANRETKRFFDLVRTFDNAMLVTHSSEGPLHARPMALADVSNNGDVWFVTRESSPKVHEVAHDRRALVVAQQKGTYLTLSGRAEIEHDRKRVHDLWSERWRVWFADKNDPELVLLCVHGEQGEYWDYSRKEGLKVVLRAAAAYVRGGPFKVPD